MANTRYTYKEEIHVKITSKLTVSSLVHLLNGRFQFWKTFSVPSQGLKKIKREENESFVVDFWWIVSAIWGDFPVGTPTKKWCPDVDDVFEFSPLMMGRLLLTIIFIFVTQWVKLRIWWSVLKQKFGFLPTVHTTVSYHPKYRRVGVKKGFAIVIERIFQIKSRLMMATL